MREKITNNLSLKILAFLIAVCMWLLVVNIDDPVSEEIYSGIPVQVVHEEVVTDNNSTYQIVDDTQEVSVTVVAKRSVLDKIKSEDITAVADMRELTLRTQVPIEVKVEGFKYEKAYATPRNLQVQIDEEEKNNFPITPTTIGTVREGYVIAELNALPQKVTLRGPKKVIDSISKVMAEVDVSGLSESTTLEAKLVLYDVNNNVVDQTLLANNLGKEGVSVSVELFQIKDVPIKLDTSEVSAAEGYKIGDITVEPQKVSITGDESTLSKISEIDVPAEAISVSDLTQKYEKTIDISEYLPEGVSLVETNASNVVITIAVEQPGTRSYEVSINSIVVNNLSPDLELNYGSVVDLEIQVRGSNEKLDLFSIAKKVSIDLKNYTVPGIYTVPVTVELPRGCSLVNDVSVEVVLERKQEENSKQEE
ncbi:MAG: CdaR family protein [Dorea sp.]|nr:CdaR family protein [Dorea sp.]MDY2812425.1 CdaR family protein [Dorea sp.]